jgi:hypothetical protein
MGGPDQAGDEFEDSRELKPVRGSFTRILGGARSREERRGVVSFADASLFEQFGLPVQVS